MHGIVVSTFFGNIKLQFDCGRLVRIMRTEQAVGGDPIDAEYLDPVMKCLHGEADGRSIPVKLTGTNFQISVWNALREIPWGTVTTYSALASASGNPLAIRAVAGACRKNPCMIIIPCHRVVRRDSGLGGFSWGINLKQVLLRREGIILHTDRILQL